MSNCRTPESDIEWLGLEETSVAELGPCAQEMAMSWELYDDLLGWKEILFVILCGSSVSWNPVWACKAESFLILNLTIHTTFFHHLCSLSVLLEQHLCLMFSSASLLCMPFKLFLGASCIVSRQNTVNITTPFQCCRFCKGIVKFLDLQIHHHPLCFAWSFSSRPHETDLHSGRSQYKRAMAGQQKISSSTKVTVLSSPNNESLPSSLFA